MKLTKEQSKLVEDHWQLIMKISNDYRRKNRDLLSTKKLTKEDVEQIALLKACDIALKSKQIEFEFSTYLYHNLYRNMNREIGNFNIMKIPRRDNWHKDNVSLNEEYNFISRNGVSELDRPLNTTDNTSEIALRIDMIEDKSTDLEGEYVILRDSLLQYFDNNIVTALIMGLEGYGLTEICEYLNVKLSTFNNKLYKARKELKRLHLEEGLFVN